MKKVPDKYLAAKSLGGQKSLSNDFHKGIKDLRNKYKTAKGLRRRLKKSVAGSSIMHVAAKDLEAVSAAANDGGLEMANMGEKHGLYKIKLTGSDSKIDEIAAAHGKRIRR